MLIIQGLAFCNGIAIAGKIETTAISAVRRGYLEPELNITKRNIAEPPLVLYPCFDGFYINRSGCGVACAQKRINVVAAVITTVHIPGGAANSYISINRFGIPIARIVI